MDNIVPYLFGFTLIAGLAICIWQFFSVRRSQEQNTPAVHGEKQPDGSIKGEERAL